MKLYFIVLNIYVDLSSMLQLQLVYVLKFIKPGAPMVSLLAQS